MTLVNILTTILILLVVIGLPIILIRVWLISIRNQKRAIWLSEQTWQLLQVQVPKENDKSPLAAEQMFAALHGVLRDDPIIQEFFAFEIVATKDSISFFVFTPNHLRDFLEGQIYAQFPEVEIKPVLDYTQSLSQENLVIASAEINLNKQDFFPIKTFPSFQVDPLAGITSVLTKLEADEKICLQVCLKPVSDSWQSRGISYVKAAQSGKASMSISLSRVFANTLMFLGQMFVQAVNPKNPVTGFNAGETKTEISGPMQEALKGIEQKVTKLGFKTKIRVLAISRDEISAKTRIQSAVAAFKQFNTTNQNGFMVKEIKIQDQRLIEEYTARNIENGGNIFNIEELASIYHFPNQTVETPGLVWSGPKKGEAPANLPIKDEVLAQDLTLIGVTDFRDSAKEFGIKLDDRRRHIYIIGKSGVGKTTLMENMIIDDIRENRGVIVVDPHGELADKIAASIPRRRLTDTVIFDPSDREFPIGFNLLEHIDDDMKPTVASGFVGIFKKIFGYSWGPRLEHILRNTVLTLLDVPNSTMLGIPKILTDAKFREEALEFVKDPIIQDFWINEFGSMDNKMRAEAVSPVLNKVGQFLSTPTIRNIVGQPHSNIDIRQIMDEEKILIVNLSRGKIGEDNTALMGAMMITKVQLAAMSRADVAETARPDCFLYVDEFQNFATESFATILSEARKYHLGLTIANQYIAQMPEEVRDAVFGNVGSIASFRVGASDGEFLVKEFAPVFDLNDLVNLEKFHIYIKLLIDGIAANAFSANTLPPREIEENIYDEIREHSRRSYSRPRQLVEAEIEKWSGIKEKLEASRAAKEASKMLEQAAIVLESKRQEKKDAIIHSTTLTTEKSQVQAPSTSPVEMTKRGEEINQSNELKVIGQYIYKQQDQKGGRKWFLGEKVIDEYNKEMSKQKRKDEKRAARLESQVDSQIQAE